MAKRIPIIVLAIMLLTSLALSEEIIDVSQYSIEELVQIRIVVEEEINNRISHAQATLMPGKYVTGIDIAAGSYIIMGLMDKAPNGYTPQILYAESSEKADQWDYIDYSYLKEGEKWRISVQDGMVIEIRYGEFAFQQEAPFLFAPK